MSVPKVRIRNLNDFPINSDGEFILYWMIANRRPRYNYSLERAIEWAEQLDKPLVVLEALRCRYEWASDRIHRFVLQGMADNREAFAATNVRYFCYVEPKHGDGSGLLETIAKSAALIVTDDFPCFFIPQMLSRVSDRLPIFMEAVDSNGLLPMRAASTIYPTAYAFRRFLQKELPAQLPYLPKSNPLARKKFAKSKPLPRKIRERWPEASTKVLTGEPTAFADFPIDHVVGPASFDGGFKQAAKTLKRFLDRRFEHYSECRNVPDERVTSELSPYLHFGHISAHEIFQSIVSREVWAIEKILDQKTNGKREGWWGMSGAAEGFLDELVTWRELGYNMCWQDESYDQFNSLPDWAQKTLNDHSLDERDPCYTLDEFESASTHDDLWNAAQNQLVTEGRLHNYMRMIWGKKILEWSESPREALRIMIQLNNKYAVDGRNPNSYSGIFWCLGRYDRPWGPERPIFGKIRYMSSENTMRKFCTSEYMKLYGKTTDRQGSLF